MWGVGGGSYLQLRSSSWPRMLQFSVAILGLFLSKYQKDQFRLPTILFSHDAIERYKVNTQILSTRRSSSSVLASKLYRRRRRIWNIEVLDTITPSDDELTERFVVVKWVSPGGDSEHQQTEEEDCESLHLTVGVQLLAGRRNTGCLYTLLPRLPLLPLYLPLNTVNDNVRTRTTK